MLTVAEQLPQWRGNYDIGYVGFTVTKGSFISAGISWFSRWSDIPKVPAPTHCFIILGEDETVEAFASGVKRGTLSAYLANEDVCLLVRRPRDYSRAIGESIANEALTHLGHGYDYFLIGALAISNTFLGHFFTKLTGGWFQRAVTSLADNRKEEMCSELVTLALQAQQSLKLRGCLIQPARVVKPVDLFIDPFCFEPPDYAVELVTKKQQISSSLSH